MNSFNRDNRDAPSVSFSATRPLRRLTAVLLLGGTALAAPMLASALGALPPLPPPPGELAVGPEQNAGPGAGPAFGPRGHHRGRHGGPFLHELRTLDLSEAQRASIRTAMKSAWESGRSQHEALRSLQRAALITAPGAPNYGSVVNQLADAEANAARDRVQRLAALKAEIYGMLTDAQKATLNEKLKNLPEPPARGERGDKGGFRDR